MLKKVLIVLLVSVSTCGILFTTSCKSCNKDKKETTTETKVDTTTTTTPVPTISAEHGDTSMIPVLSKVLDDAFAASKQKNYAALAPYIVYRGPDSLRHGNDGFTLKNNYEKSIVRITSDVFNKWNNNLESLDYGRVFTLPQPDGRPMPVLEVIFISKKNVNRKFFGFLNINGEYKIADVTSYL